MPAWTVNVSYFGYTALLVLSAAAWLAALYEHVVHGRYELGLVDKSARDFGRMVAHQGEPALWLGLACGGLAFLLAVPALFSSAESAPVAHTHRVYQMKSVGILFCLLFFVTVARVRMGAFDFDVMSVVVFAWSVWVVASGWYAYAGGKAVAGPEVWWLGLGVALLILAALAAFLIAWELNGGLGRLW